MGRGHPVARLSLAPSIDRGRLRRLSRRDKLELERRAIDTFRATARFFASPGEEGSLGDDFIALAVLRHHGVPTRLLDWSSSLYVASYFAASNLNTDGDLWTFSYQDYVIEGRKQWERWKETTVGRSGRPEDFNASLTAFVVNEPPPWIVAMFYPAGFPRQNAQRGAYTLTARFNLDHGQGLKTLLVSQDRYHRFVIPAKLKAKLCRLLREEHGVWQGSLFPDMAGAAQTARTLFGRVGHGIRDGV